MLRDLPRPVDRAQIAPCRESSTGQTNQNNIQIRKNGSTQVAISQTPIFANIGYTQTIATTMYFNGSTDYVEIYAYVSSGSFQGHTVDSSYPRYTYFSGCLLRGA